MRALSSGVTGFDIHCSQVVFELLHGTRTNYRARNTLLCHTPRKCEYGWFDRPCLAKCNIELDGGERGVVITIRQSALFIA